MNRGRAVTSVWCAAILALCLLLLPHDWKGLGAIPVFAWMACWSLLGPHRADPFDEPDERGELDDDPAAEELDDWPARLADDEHQADEADRSLPDEDADPVGHYAALARRYTIWQQQGPDDGPHLLTAPGPAGVLQPEPGPVPQSGGPGPAVGTGEPGPPADYPPGDQLAELQHEHDADPLACAPGDPCALCRSVEIPEWPHAENLAADMAADAALDRVRTAFDFIRRTVL